MYERPWLRSAAIQCQCQGASGQLILGAMHLHKIPNANMTEEKPSDHEEANVHEKMNRQEDHEGKADELPF